MDTFIHRPDLNMYGSNDDSLFSLSQFDLELQQQAQAAIQQQQQQQQQQQYQLQQQLQQQQQQQYTLEQRPIQDLWQDFDRYLPIDCQPFMMNEPAMNAPSAFNPSMPTLTATMYDKGPAPFAPSINSNPSPLYDPAAKPDNADFSPPVDLNLTPVVLSQWNSTDMIKQEYPSPAEYSDSLSPPQKSTPLMASMSSPPQQTSKDTNDQLLVASTSTSSSQSPPPTSSSMAPNVADIIARMNWEMSTLSNLDSNKVPIQRLKSSNENGLATSPSNTLNGGTKQKKTAHNAIERRYRNNINDRITELKNAVPALLHAKPKDKDRITAGGGGAGKRGRLDDDDDDIGEDGEEYLDGVAVATKLNKATILCKATEYINHLKRTGNDMKRENDALQNLLAQLPGGHEVLAHYQIQKVQREEAMQRQMMMERQLMKQEQLERKRTASKRKRAKRRQSNLDDDHDDGSLSSNSGDHPHTPPSDNNRVFMALFMAISFFSSSPLTTTAGSDQLNNHHHVSRTAAGQMDAAASVANSNNSYYSSTSTNNQPGTLWFSINDAWSILRWVVFVACLTQLLFPYLKPYLFGHSFRVRRTSRLRHHRLVSVKTAKLGLNSTKATTLAISPGDAKCMQMHQLLTKRLITEHGDTTSRLSYKNKVMLFLALVKELAQFTLRHVFGFDVATEGYSGDIDGGDDDEMEQHKLRRWGHVFKWIKLNECECLGGNSVLSRATMLYHSVRMLNLVDSLEEEMDYYNNSDDEQETRQRQLSSMRARAYATAAIQMVMAIPYATMAMRAADYLWGIALMDATEEDTWACITEEDDDLETSMMEALSTKEPWIETLDVVRTQLSTWTKVSATATATPMGLSLSSNAPSLVPTAILSNLYILDQMASHLRNLIDGMIHPAGARSDPLAFFAHISSALDDDSQRLAGWFALVGITVESLWRHDTERAEQAMLTLVHRVPRAMIVPGFSKKKTRQGELDTMAKQQIAHTLAGATLLQKQDNQEGIKELEIASSLRQRKNKRALPTTNELEAMHIEGRVMALAEFAVLLVGLEAWVSTWEQSSDDHTSKASETTSDDATALETSNEQVRLAALALRRMVCRPALAGLKTQQVIIDRLSKVGRIMDDGCDEEEDTDSAACEHLADGNAQKDGRIEKVMAIIHGN